MSDSSTGRILSVIDAGLQTPVPDPTYGEVSSKRHDLCARCEDADPVEGGDLCSDCRAFLLGDSDEDPAVGGDAEVAEGVAVIGVIGVSAADALDAFGRIGAALDHVAVVVSRARDRIMSETERGERTR